MSEEDEMAAKKTTKASAKKAVKAPRARRYKSPDGSYLMIEENARLGPQVVWYIPEHGVGGAVGDIEPTDTLPGDPEERRSQWEVNTAYRAVQPFADGHVKHYGFTFESMAKAKLALRAANEALRSDTLMPAWAVAALEAGWTPPEGWEP